MTISFTNSIKQYLLVILFLLSACSLPPEYVGDKFPRTHHVDIFYSANDVKRPYKVIGHLTGHKYFKEAEEKNLLQMAKMNGGDAIIIMPENALDPKHSHAGVLKYN